MISHKYHSLVEYKIVTLECFLGTYPLLKHFMKLAFINHICNIYSTNGFGTIS